MNFNIGDKVVCINDKWIGYSNSQLIEGKNYIVENLTTKSLIRVEDIKEFVDKSRFISLIEYRRMKINKIYEI